MSFKDFKLLGYTLTEDEIIKAEKQIVASYKAALKTIDQAVKTQYANLAGVDPTDAGYYNEMLKYDRLTKLQIQITKAYSGIGIKAKIATILKIAFTNNYYRQQFANKWIAIKSLFTAIPNSIVELSVFSTADRLLKFSDIIKSKWGGAQYLSSHAPLSELILKNKTKHLNDIFESIRQGLIMGDGYAVTSRKLKEIIGVYISKNGETITSGAIADMIRIVRTESNRVMNDAAYAAQKQLQQQGIDVKKMWLATLDMRTRPVHGRLDGKKQEIDEPFKYGGFSPMRPGQFGIANQDINCRCVTVDIIDDTPPTVRRGLNPETGKSELFEYTDFNSWTAKNGLSYNKSGILTKK